MLRREPGIMCNYMTIPRAIQTWNLNRLNDIDRLMLKKADIQKITILYVEKITVGVSRVKPSGSGKIYTDFDTKMTLNKCSATNMLALAPSQRYKPTNSLSKGGIEP